MFSPRCLSPLDVYIYTATPSCPELNASFVFVQRKLLFARMHHRPSLSKQIKWRRKGSIRTYHLELALIVFLVFYNNAYVNLHSIKIGTYAL